MPWNLFLLTGISLFALPQEIDISRGAMGLLTPILEGRRVLRNKLIAVF
jgi:hypothetical protein